MLEDLAEARINVKLKINSKNIKMMFSTFPEKRKTVYYNTEIEEVRSYLYLGQEITPGNSILNEIKRRIRSEWSSNAKNSIFSEEQHVFI